MLGMSSFLAQVVQKNITVVNNTGNGTSAGLMDVL